MKGLLYAGLLVCPVIWHQACPDQGAAPLTGEVLVALDGGDFDCLRFSPSGDHLAVAQVLLQDDFRNTQVLVLDVENRTADTVLSAALAGPYGYYGAFVTNLEWFGEERLAIRIFDGDIDATIVTVELKSGVIVAEERAISDLEFAFPRLPPELQRIAHRLGELYPALPARHGVIPGLLEAALFDFPVILADTAVILQHDYAGYDSYVWYYGLTDSLAFPILEMPPRAIAAFGGGALVGNSVVFAVRRESEAQLFLYDGSVPPRLLERIPLHRQTPIVSARHISDRGAWFIVRVYGPYARGNNPAFWFDGSGVRAFTDVPELYDFDVHIASRRVAFAYWEGDQRNILVKRLLLE